MASREGQDLVNCRAQQCLIIIPLNVAEVRGAERVLHPNQRVLGAQHRLILVNVHGRRTRLTLVECCRQRAALDDLRPAGVDEKRGWLHARQILRRHDAVRLGVQRKVQAEHVCCGEEFFAAWSNLKTRLACPRHRAFPTPAQDTHLKCLPDPRDKAADAAKSIDAECLARHPGPQGAEPLAGLEPLHLVRIWRKAARISPQVSSAVALGEPAPPAETTMPCSVQVGRSMWLTLRPVWLISLSPGSCSMTARGTAERCWISKAASASPKRVARAAGSFTLGPHGR